MTDKLPDLPFADVDVAKLLKAIDGKTRGIPHRRAKGLAYWLMRDWRDQWTDATGKVGVCGGHEWDGRINRSGSNEGQAERN